MTTRERNPFLRYPRASLLVTGLLCLPLLWPLGRFGVSAEVTALLQGDQRNLSMYQRARELLGADEMVLVSLEHPALFSPAGLGLVGLLSDALERLPGVTEIKSLTHAVQPVRRGTRFVMVPFLPDPPWDPDKLAAFRDFCLSHPLVRNLLVSADGRHTLITARFSGPPVGAGEQAAFAERLNTALAPARESGVPLRVLALPLIEAEIRATLHRDLRWFVPASAGVVVLVLWGAFRSLRLVGFTLLNQAGVLLLLPGVMALTGRALNVFTVLLVPLVAGLHLTLLMHLLTAWQRARGREADPAQALRATLADVQQPAFYAVLTSVLGLLSLTTGSVPQMRDFGWLGAAGLALAWGVTFGPGLALLQCWGGSLGGRPACGVVPERRRTSGRWTAWVRAHRRAVGVGVGLVAALAVAGVMQLRTDIRMTEMLAPSSPTRQALEELDTVYGGINVVPIEFDTGVTNGVNRPGFLRYLERVHCAAAARPEPTAVYSYAQLLALVNQIWEGGAPGALRLPENPLLLGLFTSALRAYEFPLLEALASPDFRTAQLVLRTRHLPAQEYLGMIRAVLAEAERDRPPEVSVSAARGLHDILEADRRLLRSQTRSAAVAAGTLGLTLALLWRSVRLAVVALVINALPVALVLAGAAWAGVPLNSITVMVGALALGVAVDDTVHLLTHWQMSRRRGHSPSAAVRAALEVKGPPIFWTTVILVAVLALVAGASFPPVMQFGLLLSGALLAALVMVLMALPAWLSRGE